MALIEYLKLVRNDIYFERIVGALKIRFQEIPHTIQWHLPLRRTRENLARLESFRDRYWGRRCFIVANGPSLKHTDLKPLAGEVTFGMNRIYLLDKEYFRPSFLVVIDEDCQLRQFTREYDEVDLLSFYNWNCRSLFRPSERRLYVKQNLSAPRFSTDLRRGLWTGHSVNYVCLQLAYHMGFSEVYLVGKDHSYNFPEGSKAIKLLKSTGAEANHFVPGYYREGMVWRVPDPKGEEYAYRLARTAFEKAGRKIMDATIGGKLDVFEKVDYRSLFPAGTRAKPEMRATHQG